MATPPALDVIRDPSGGSNTPEISDFPTGPPGGGANAATAPLLGSDDFEEGAPPVEDNFSGTGMGGPVADSSIAPTERLTSEVGATWQVVKHPDGVQRVLMSTTEGDTVDAGRVTIDAEDANEMFKASGAVWDEGTQTWEGVPEKAIKSVRAGRLNYPEWLIAKYKTGEVGIVNNLIWQKFLRGEMSREDATAKSDENLLKVQLGEQPNTAWNNGFGKLVAKAILRPAESLIDGDIGKLVGETVLHPVKAASAVSRFSTGEAAEQIPNSAAAGKQAIVGAAVAGVVGAGLVATTASGGLAAPGAATAVVGLMEMGAAVGVFNYSRDNEAASTAGDMAKAGYDDATIKRLAPVAGVVKGALEVVGFKFMTAPVKKVFLANVLASDAMKAALSKWYVSYAKEIGGEVSTEMGQTAVDQFVNYLAATAENKPEKLQNVDNLLGEQWDTFLKTLGATLVMGAPGAALEGRAQSKVTTKEAAAVKVMDAKIEADLKSRGVKIADAPAPVALNTEPIVVADEAPVLDEAGAAEAIVADVEAERHQTLIDEQEETDAAAETRLRQEAADDQLQADLVAHEKGLSTDQELVEAVAVEEPLGETLADQATGKGKERREMEKKTLAVANAAQITSVESDITGVDNELDALYVTRRQRAAKGLSLVNTDAQIQALFDRKEGLIHKVAELKMPPTDGVSGNANLEMRAGVLGAAVDEAFTLGGDEARRQAKADMAVAEEEFKAAKGELRAKAKERLDKARAQLDALVDAVRARPKLIKEIAAENGLTGAEVRKLLANKTPALMTEAKFDEFIAEFRAEAEAKKEWKTALAALGKVIKEKELVNESRARTILGLPKAKDMTIQQLLDYATELAKFQKQDELLTEKMTEALKGTEMDGVRTMRELRDRAAAILKTDPKNLSGLVIREWHVATPDTQLANMHPLFRFAVELTRQAAREGLSTFLAWKEKNAKLAAAAMQSRAKQQGLGRRLANLFLNQQREVMAYIEEQDPAAKIKLAAGLTPEEIAWADSWTGFAKWAYDYLLTTKALEGSRYAGAYVPHILRSFTELLELAKDKGVKAFLKALKDRFTSTTADMTAMDTKGNPLAYKAFLKNTLRREGGAASQNIALSMDFYARKLFDKIALDKVVPVIDGAAKAIKSADKSVNAEKVNQVVHEFLKEFINSKKGNSKALFLQGGIAESVLRFGQAGASLAYIKLNMALQLASPVGATMAELPVLGNTGILKAKSRKLTAKGRAVIAKYQAFVGETLKSEVLDPSKSLQEKAGVATNAIWHIIHNGVMEDLLLGSMTDAEWAAGEISQARLNEIEINAGRWIDIRGNKSIRGSSVLGASFTQFKGWMVPPILTTLGNVQALLKTMWSPLTPEKRMTKQQAKDFVYTAEVALITYAAKAQLGDDDPKDDSFKARFKRYLLGELGSNMSLLTGASSFLTPFAGVAWLLRVGHNLFLLAHLGEGAEGDNPEMRERGWKGLKKQLPLSKAVPSEDEEN